MFARRLNCLHLHVSLEFNLHKTLVLVLILVLWGRWYLLNLTIVPILGRTNSPFQR